MTSAMRPVYPPATGDMGEHPLVYLGIMGPQGWRAPRCGLIRMSTSPGRGWH